MFFLRVTIINIFFSLPQVSDISLVIDVTRQVNRECCWVTCIVILINLPVSSGESRQVDRQVIDREIRDKKKSIMNDLIYERDGRRNGTLNSNTHTHTHTHTHTEA